MAELTSIKTVLTALRQRPRAVARLFGSSEYPNLSGWVYFYQMKRGVLVAAEVTGLPLPDKGQERMFGFHIHGGAWCSGTQDDPFADTLTHYAGGLYGPVFSQRDPSSDGYCAFLAG